MKLIDRFSFFLTNCGFHQGPLPYAKNRSAPGHAVQDDRKPLKIEQTYLCLNCDEIFPEEYRQCPSCASTNVFPLAKFLPPLKFTRVMIKTFPVQVPNLSGSTATQAPLKEE